MLNIVNTYLVIFCFLFLSNNFFAQNPLTLDVEPEDRICFALYTVHENTLKLTAQFFPIKNFEPLYATLEIEKNGKWEEVAKADIIYPGYIAPFRVGKWDDTKEVKYRVKYDNKAKAKYEGIIRKNPIDRAEFVMAAFSCNSTVPNHGGNISRKDIVDNIKKLKPDLLFFAGDQVYNHSEHLKFWLKFGRDFGDIIRNTPTICIVDDHDVGQGNIWGESGERRAKSIGGSLGGYYMPPEYIKEVERAQTSHLPDPYDATPIGDGIGVYYTDLKWGGIGFAILEDRKFKSSVVKTVEANPEIFTKGHTDALFDPNFDAKKLDIPGNKLLGDRQLEFLENWTTDWSDTEMKTVLSQTIFAQANNYTGKHDRQILADFDTNGWPQSGRNKALRVIRKSFSPMIAGDQHLATLVQHGIEDWGNAGYSFATPAIANYWLRWWDPKQPGKNKKENAPNYTGEFLDGFENKMTVMAVANPTLPEIEEGGKLSTRAAGFGIVKYNKTARSITFECWGRNIDITNPNNKQYTGWPITISQMDNFVIKEGYELPTLEISKANQVVTIRDGYTNEVISSIRIVGKFYQPKVMRTGEYRIEIGEGKSKVRIDKLVAEKQNSKKLKIKI